MLKKEKVETVGSLEALREDFVDLAGLAVDYTAYLDNTSSAAGELVQLSDRALRSLGNSAISTEEYASVLSLMPDFRVQTAIALQQGVAADNIACELSGRLNKLSEESGPKSTVHQACPIAEKMYYHSSEIAQRARRASRYLNHTVTFDLEGEDIRDHIRIPMLTVEGETLHGRDQAHTLIDALDSYLGSLGLQATGMVIGSTQ